MIRPKAWNHQQLPNAGLSLFFMFEGLMGTLALVIVFLILLSGDEGIVIWLFAVLCAVVPGYVLQWGHIQYVRGKLDGRSRQRLWLANMIYNLVLFPMVLLPTGLASTLGTEDEAIMFMTPITANAALIAGLSVWGWVRERRALQSVS